MALCVGCGGSVKGKEKKIGWFLEVQKYIQHEVYLLWEECSKKKIVESWRDLEILKTTCPMSVHTCVEHVKICM